MHSCGEITVAGGFLHSGQFFNLPDGVLVCPVELDGLLDHVLVGSGSSSPGYGLQWHKILLFNDGRTIRVISYKER